MLDAKPRRIHPACDGADADNYNSRGQNIRNHRIHLFPPYCRSAQILDFF